MYSNYTIVGRVAKIEMRYTPSGQAVTTMNIPTNRTWNDANGQKVKETTWHKVTVWGRMAESCNQFLQKGSLVLVEGRLTPDPETGGPKIYTKKDGSAGASYEVTASEVKFLSTRESDGEHQEHETEEETPF